MKSQVRFAKMKSQVCFAVEKGTSHRGLSDQKSGHAPFLCKLYFYHITRLLAELGVKWTPLVAWEGAQPLFLAYFDINSPRMPSTRPNHTSFYPQNTINILLLCCTLILDVETEVWRRSDFDPFWHPFCPFCPFC